MLALGDWDVSDGLGSSHDRFLYSILPFQSSLWEAEDGSILLHGTSNTRIWDVGLK
jgi:hypothetical protein